MSFLNPSLDNESVRFDLNECIARGRTLTSGYESAHPFPHVIIDDFLPRECLKRVVSEFPKREQGRFADAHSRLKTGYQLDTIKSIYITNLLYALNSASFLAFVEHATGLRGVVGDPYYLGGGLHESVRGGHLSIHADFNHHDRLRLWRRLNLIVFLNDDWCDEYGGHLELWTEDMKTCAARIAPIMSRAVIFNTDATSYHGHPEPLRCPEGVYRRSIALYYYTAPVTDAREQKAYTTRFQRRPGTGDRMDYKSSLRSAARDICPPFLWRWMSR